MESQATISAWAEATFGSASTKARVAARANEEMAELLRALTTGNEVKAAEEAADVVIVLCRMGHNLDWHSPPSGPQTPTSALAFALATQAHVWLAYALHHLALAGDRGVDIEVNDCVRSLVALAHHLGTSLPGEIDRKMATNRARVWKLDGSGHGYHVRPGKEA